MKPHLIKPYGDTLNDGIVQLSFTLPVEYGEKAKKAAKEYAAKLNFKNINVALASKIADNFTYFVVFAEAKPVIDYSKIKTDTVKIKEMSFYEINNLIKKKLKRHIVVVGAAIGSDAHTVGIDAIMNMKGYNQDYGLERYSQIKTLNMGAQVPVKSLVDKALDIEADAILVSQAVTKRDSHIYNLRELVNYLKKKKIRKRFLVVAGGPGITNEMAVKLGCDAGFGRGTRPSQVASFLADKLIKKRGKK